MSHWMLSFLAASLVLLGAVLPTHVVAAPRDEDGRAVPTRIHDRARAEGQVRVLLELSLPSGRLAEDALSNQARTAYRHEITDTASRVLSRLAKHPHRVLRQYLAAPVIALEVGPAALQELEAASFLVKRVVEDRLHAPVLVDSVPLIGADEAWARGFDGTGLVVAVIDSGVDSAHPFLAGKVVEEACYSTTTRRRSTSLCPNGTDEQVGPGAAADCSLEGCWHGTHVAGIAAGNGTPSDLAIWGVGRGASIMAVQIFSRFTRSADCGGAPPCIRAYTSDILAALERVYVLRTTHAFAAVNMSLGGGLFSSTCDTEPYKPFIDNLRAVGIATVVASGNDGATGQLSAPACVSTAVSVGATTKDDQVAYFSNVAPFLSLFAPGDGIISSFAGGGFAMASGTSMAAPHVTGAWAVLKQAKPTASVDEILRALNDTGVMIADTRAGTGTIRPRIQVDFALSDLLNPGAPIIASISPERGTVGTSLTVTVNGIRFEPGASAAFGAGVTVTSTTVVSATQLSVALAIAATAALGPRDVTVTNPNGQSVVRPGGFTVVPPPPTISLAFLGKLRDRVAGSASVLSPDGALDGTFRVTVGAGSGPRTVTRLELRRDAGGVWDTDPATPHWALGVSASLDSALLNAGDGTVSFAVADGSAFVVFASDFGSVFSPGTSFSLTVTLADGSSATATVSLQAAPTIASVSPGSGAPGASFTVTVTGTNFQAGASASFGAGVTVTSTTVVSATQLSVALAIATTAALGPRDVTVTNPDGQSAVRPGGFTVAPPPPTISLAFLGKLRDRVGAGPAAFSPDGALDGSFRVTVAAGSGPRTVTRLELRREAGGVWDTDPATPHWALGVSASLDGALLNAGDGAVSFAVTDGSAFVLFASDFGSVFTLGTSFSLTVTLADGSSATATVSLQATPTIASVSPGSGAPGASFTVTVTGTNFQAGASASFGAGVTVTSTTVVSATQLSVALAIAAAAALGPRDVTVTNPDGQSAVRPGGFAVAPSPPTISLAFLGKLRDTVGAGPAAFSPDGALDGTFQVTVGVGSGPRTVTRLELRRDAGGVWDTDPASPHWALGAAASLDGALLNAADGTVSLPVADGSALFVFASDFGSVFTPGTSFSLTVTLADGSVVTVPTTIP
jgi:subtilisin family serine protease